MTASMTTEPRASLVERLRRRATCTDSGGMGFFSQYDSHLLRESADEIARLEALRTQGDGEWVLVPREPTDDMLDAWSGAAYYPGNDDEIVRGWHAMLSASLTQTSSREEGANG